MATAVAGDPLILTTLVRLGRFEADQVAQARTALAKGGDEPAEQVLVRRGLVDELGIARAYADDWHLPLVGDGDEEPGDGEALAKLVAEKTCVAGHLVPWRQADAAVEVAFASPERLDQVAMLRFLTGRLIRPVIAPASAIEKRIEALYRSGGDIVGGAAASFDEGEAGEAIQRSEDDLLDLDAPPPLGEGGRIVKMVNQILEQALRTGASDIHLEPFEDSCKVRLRIDGVLHELPAPSKSVYMMIISRYKILAKMDIAEKRVPQDGAIAVKTGDRRIDLRVNTVPTVGGEKMVMRILDKGAIPLELTNLGLSQRQNDDLVESLEMPNGLALVTGPTGSGKSTTLYSCLNLLNKPTTNICTVEDPVEYKFHGMNQVHVKAQIGLTFATALRSFLRQDPDIIMVGEVRDQETAEICLRAALTGHFVLSTLHTNDALSAITRLGDMGIEPFLLSTSLRVLEAQRLGRRLCGSCKEPYEVDAETAEYSGLEEGQLVYRPAGCPRCRRVGYKGRVGIFEVVKITSKLASLVATRAPLPELRQQARSEGMQLLYDSALDKVREGVTSLDVAMSVTMSDEE